MSTPGPERLGVQRGVQKNSSLGFQEQPARKPYEPPEMVEGGVLEALERIGTDNRQVLAALEAAQARVEDVEEDARVLYAALAQTIRWVRADRLEDGIEDLPHEVASVAPLLLVLDRYDAGREEPVDRAAPPQDTAQAVENVADPVTPEEPGLTPCPECRQGKHQNCTEAVLADDDQWWPCPCHQAGHS